MIRPAPGDSEIELRLLIDAIYLKYHYDFREYAAASLKRFRSVADACVRASESMRSTSAFSAA